MHFMRKCSPKNWFCSLDIRYLKKKKRQIIFIRGRKVFKMIFGNKMKGIIMYFLPNLNTK